jgi:AcrR family transcriptional regulator
MTKRERTVHTRNQLIAAADDAFNRSGSTLTRLAEVSRQVGLSSGGLCFHFDSRETLASAVVSRASATLRSTTGRIRRNRTSALQRLINLPHGLAALLRNDAFVKAGFLLSCDGHGGVHPNAREEWHACVRRLLAEAAEEGGLAPGTSQKHATCAIAGFRSLQLPCPASPEAPPHEPTGSGITGHLVGSAP